MDHPYHWKDNSVTLPELQSVVEKYLLLADKNIIKFLTSVYVANKMTSLTPTWVFLVGASSGGKSTLLEPFSYIESSFFIDDLSGKTLFSGMRSTHGQENSLIYKIPPNGMVFITDFTLMLDKEETTAKEIMSQLRLIYDGKFKSFKGNSENQDWQGRFGLVAGVTTAVYEKQQQYAALGERMVYYFFDQPSRSEATERALNNIDKTQAIKEEIGKAFSEYMIQYLHPSLYEVSMEVKKNLISLSDLATRARSSVSRKRYSRDNPITHINALEMPMRMAKQLLNVGQGLMNLNDDHKLNEADGKILYKIALDSIPMERRRVMEKLTLFMQSDVSGIAAALGLPYDTVKLHLEDLSALGVLIQHKQATAGRFYYELKPEFRDLISNFGNIGMTNKVLEEEVPLPEEVGWEVR